MGGASGSGALPTRLPLERLGQELSLFMLWVTVKWGPEACDEEVHKQDQNIRYWSPLKNRYNGAMSFQRKLRVGSISMYSISIPRQGGWCVWKEAAGQDPKREYCGIRNGDFLCFSVTDWQPFVGVVSWCDNGKNTNTRKMMPIA